jgi:uncharacterized membrane protein
MLNELRFFARSVSYDIRKGLLARPLAITALYGALAIGMVVAEHKFPALTRLASHSAWITREDVTAAQLILATIAGSMMTTVSVVFSVLIMALRSISRSISCGNTVAATCPSRSACFVH